MLFKNLDPIEKYRRRALRNDIEYLSGRWQRHTEFVNRNILATVRVRPGSNVLDVGCGNGGLLGAMAGQIASGIGIVPTDEERALLERQPHPSNIHFRTALATELPFSSAAFHLTVFNGVILLLRDLDEAEKAISELARVTKPDGLVWIGEALIEKPAARSAFKTVAKVAKNARRLLAGKPIPVVRQLLVTPPAWITGCAGRHGLQLIHDRPHPMLDRDGQHLISTSRHDFVLTAVSGAI